MHDKLLKQVPLTGISNQSAAPEHRTAVKRSENTIFSARQHMLSTLYDIARPSVCLSDRPSVTRVDQSKTVEVRIMQF